MIPYFIVCWLPYRYASGLTANIYAHVMESADRKNADILADVFLKKAWIFKASWTKVDLFAFVPK